MSLSSRFLLLALLAAGGTFLSAAESGVTAPEAKPPASASQYIPAEELRYDELLQREKTRRKGALRQLKMDRRAVENETTALVEGVGKLSPWAQTEIRRENEDRTVLFRMWAGGGDQTTVKRDFAQICKKEDADVDKSYEDQVILKLAGSPALAEKLLPGLAKEFLIRQIGCERESVAIVPLGTAGDCKVIGQKPKTVLFDAIEIRGGGNLAGLESLRKGECQIAMTNARPSAEWFPGGKAPRELGDLGSSTQTVPVALDGLAMVVRDETGAPPKLTLEQLARIFSGSIRNWKDVGGSRTDAIQIFYLNDEVEGRASSTFQDQLLRHFNVTLSRDAKPFATSAELRDALVKQPAAIGFVSFTEKGQLHDIPIASGPATQELKPTRLTIRQDYPLRRELYLFLSPQGDRKTAEKFAAFVLSSEGQRVVAELGFVDHGRVGSKERAELAKQKAGLLARTDLPAAYLSLIAPLDRFDTPSNIRFEYKKANMEATSRLNVTSLHDMTRLVEALDEPGNKGAQVVLIGHADANGTPEANHRFGFDRAEMVQKRLRQLGVPVKDVTQANSFGHEIPVGDNTNEPGRALNRRVELWIQR